MATRSVYGRSASLLFLAGAALAQSVPVPAFREGNLAAIACRASNVKSDAMGTTRLQVEVDNRSDHAFEPTVFALRWTDAAGQECTAEVSRVPLPRVRRDLVAIQHERMRWLLGDSASD